MRRKFLAICVALLFSPPAFATGIEVETTRIGHGVSVWYAANDRVPVVDVVLSFEGAGSASDPEGKVGRATFVASLLNEGAGDLDSAAFQRLLDEHAITLQASADEDRLNVHVHCLRDDVSRAGEMLALALSKPRFDAADQARIKTEMKARLLQLDESGDYQAQRLLEQRIFQGHPYANPVYGTAESLDNITSGDAREYLKTYVTRGNVLVAASGDVDSSLLDQMLGPVVEVLPENSAGAVAVTPVKVQGAGESLHKNLAVPQSVVTFAALALARDDKRFYASYLLNYILGGSALDSRLAALRRDKGLVYHIGSALEIKRGSSYFVGTLATRNSSAEVALAQVKTVLSGLRDNGVSSEECADAKSYVLGSLPLRLDSSAAVTNTLLSMQIHRLGTDYLSRRDKLFSNVACSEISALAAELLGPEHVVFATVGGTVDGAEPPAAPLRDER